MKTLQTAPKELLDTIHAYAKAIQDCDTAALDRVLADDYTEVSPLGEVDPRSKVLQSYREQAQQGRPSVRIAVDELTVRRYDSVAIVLGRLGMTLPGQPPRNLRTVFVVRQLRGRWLLSSLQLTPIRPLPRP